MDVEGGTLLTALEEKGPGKEEVGGNTRKRSSRGEIPRKKLNLSKSSFR